MLISPSNFINHRETGNTLDLDLQSVKRKFSRVWGKIYIQLRDTHPIRKRTACLIPSNEEICDRIYVLESRFYALEVAVF